MKNIQGPQRQKKEPVPAKTEESKTEVPAPKPASAEPEEVSQADSPSFARFLTLSDMLALVDGR